MTTYERLMANEEQRALFEKEYNEFLLSEFMLEKMEESQLSVRELAKKAHVSPTVIQKLRGKDAEKITLRTFSSVLHSLGYKIALQKL